MVTNTVLTCQVVSPWPCSCECKGPCPSGSAAQAAHVMLASVSTKDWLLLALSKQEEVTLFPNLSPKEVKASEGCCQEIVIILENMYVLYFCVLLSIIQQCLYWKSPERWEHIFEQKHHSLGDPGLCHRVAGHWWHQKGEYRCRRSCGCAFTFSPNANLSLQISAIIY